VSGAARQARSRARLEAGKRIVPVEIDDVAVPQEFIRSGLLSKTDETNWREIGAVISRLLAIWINTSDQR
jgi:hypothetical protein